MKRILAITLLFAATNASAQKTKLWGDPHVFEKFATEAKKSPAYAKLLTDIDALRKSATSKNTNAAAVKSLFQKNSTLLRSLYTKTGVEFPGPMTTKSLTKPIYLFRNNSFLLNKFKNTGQNMTKIVTAPFEDSWRKTAGHSNDGGYPDSSTSQFATGKTVLVSNSVSYCATNPGWAGCRLGFCQQGYLQKFTVPANPEIIAAEVKFEYSYLYTGWDTYGGITALDLVVRADNKINSSLYNELPDGPLVEQGSNSDRWKKIATLYPLDTIDAEFGEFHAIVASSFTIEGYVTPGTVFEVKVGFGYPLGTKRGINGCYHYAEFILKKITVNYYKTAN